MVLVIIIDIYKCFYRFISFVFEFLSKNVGIFE